jgi:hypothetical protein
MSIVIVLIVVLIVGGLIVKFYPTPKSTTFLAQGEILTPDETLEELTPETVVVTEPLVETPKMSAKPAKKPQTKKKPAKKKDA